MNRRYLLGASLAAVALLVGAAVAADSLKSGPQIGEGVVPFNPLHCTGEGAGGKACLV
jgi:hypothetical protein